ncbi:MAG: DUF952 domain-containing protein [Litoreibacter sp.]
MLIYKIMTPPQWEAFRNIGQFDGAPIDITDGFIHFSTASQMVETATKHFADAGDLVLAWSDTAALGDTLKWEVSRGGAEFPHLYATWSMDQVVGHAPLPFVNGAHIFPEAP